MWIGWTSEQMEFNWKISASFTKLGILDEVRKTMISEWKCEPEHFKGRIIFMSMYNDIDGTKRWNKENCIANAHRVTGYARRFARGHWSIPKAWVGEEKWYGTHVQQTWMEKVIKLLKDMMLNFPEQQTSCAPCQQRLGKRRIGKQRKRSNIHSLQLDTIEFILRTIISVNQLSVYGAVADLCRELARKLTRYGEAPRMKIWNQWLYRLDFLLLTLFLRLMPKYKETCCVNTTRNSNNFLKTRSYPNCALALVSRRTLTKDSSSLHLVMMHLTIWKDHVERKPHLEVRNHPTWEGGSVEIRRSAQVLDVKPSVIIKDVHGVEIMIESLFRDRTVSWVRIVNGINKYVTETSQEIPVASVENRGTGKPVAKARPRPKPTLTLTPVSVP